MTRNKGSKYKKRRPWRPLLKNLPDSCKFNKLSLLAQSLYVRLICQCDDGSNYDGDPVLLQAGVFKRMIKTGLVELESITEARDELVAQGLALLYDHEGEPYVHLVQLKKYLRADVNKDVRFPDYWAKKYGRNEGGPSTERESRGANEYEKVCSGEDREDDRPPFIDFPVTSQGGDDVANYRLKLERIEVLKLQVPTLNVIAQLYEIQEWCIDNPGRRKTASQMPRFIKNWLSRSLLEQYRGDQEQQENAPEPDAEVPLPEPSEEDIDVDPSVLDQEGHDHADPPKQESDGEPALIELKEAKPEAEETDEMTIEVAQAIYFDEIEDPDS